MKCILPSFLAAVLFCGCAVNRVTTTERTAVEEALVRQSARKAISTFDFSILAGRSFYLDREIFEVQVNENPALVGDKRYFRAVFLNELLNSGLRMKSSAEEADVLVHGRIDFAAVDDGHSFIGLPSVSLPIPGITVATPELPLFSKSTQYGRVRFSAFAIDAKTGELLHQQRSKPTQKFYARWTLLFMFGWRTSNLGTPF